MTNSYPGGKGASGVYQKIISMMPRHNFYGELFAGAGYIFKTKRPAQVNLAMDLDSSVLKKINGLNQVNAVWKDKENNFETMQFSAIDWLENLPNTDIQEGMLIYLDPPYLPCTLSRPTNSTRNGQRYKFKFGVEAHKRLLELITPLKCYVMISGYQSTMYDRALVGWTKKTFMAKTRRGLKEECVWMNFNPDEITQRHDWRFFGNNFRERERLQKKLKRLRRKLTEVNVFERNFLLNGISDLYEQSHSVISVPK